MYEEGTLGDIRGPVSAVSRIPSAIARLLALPEAPPWRFRVSSKGAAIEVNPVGLLTGWLTGTSLPDLAQAHLGDAANRAWRIEQMVDAVTGHFEHYLAWTVGALVELVNTQLAGAGIEERLCPDLGSYIRYGVDDPKALILMTSGIRSRRLAHAIAADLPADLEPTREQLRLQIARMGVAGWRTRYDASAAEVLDLLDFTRVRNRSLLRTLLETGNVTVELPAIPASLPAWDGPLTLEPARDEPRPAAWPLRRRPAHRHRGDTRPGRPVSDPGHRAGHNRGNRRSSPSSGTFHHTAARGRDRPECGSSVMVIVSSMIISYTP